jgi:hypothetical protein
VGGATVGVGGMVVSVDTGSGVMLWHPAKNSTRTIKKALSFLIRICLHVTFESKNQLHGCLIDSHNLTVLFFNLR